MKRLFLLIFLIGVAVNAGAQLFQPVAELAETGSPIMVTTTHPEKQLLIAGDSAGNIIFYRLDDGTFIKKIKPHHAPVQNLQFNSNGRLLISATHDGEIKIFDFEKDKVIQAIYSPDYAGIRFVLFSIADGFIYFNGGNRMYKTRSDLTQQVFEVQRENDTIYDAVITTDRNNLIYSTGNTIKVVNTRNDQPRQEFNAGLSPVLRLALIGDSLLATWSKDGTINFWRYSLGQVELKPVFFLKAGNPGPMVFNADGKMMITGNLGNWARIWEPWDRKIKQELFRHTSIVTTSAFANNNVLYTGSADGSIIRWQRDAKTENVLQPVVKKPVAEIPKPVIKDSVIPTAVLDDSHSVKEPKAVVYENNIPKVIGGRTVKTVKDVEITVPEITVYVFDNSYIDGDTMSLFFNGKWVLDKYGVTKQKKAISLKFTKDTDNYLVLFANNLGKSPPNTAAIEFYDGSRTHYLRLSSDMNMCSAINFFYR